MELDSGLAGDPTKLQDRIRQLFGLVHASLTRGEKRPGGLQSTDLADVD
jgi:hypothetical protein